MGSKDQLMGWQLFHLEEEIWDGPSVSSNFWKGSAEKKGIAAFSVAQEADPAQCKGRILNRELCRMGMADFRSNLSSVWRLRARALSGVLDLCLKSVALEKVIQSPESIFPCRKQARECSPNM